MVPFVDLFCQYKEIKSAIDKAITETIANSSFIGGRNVKKFEEEFSEYSEISHVIGCANGTDSLEIILKAWGIGPGDEVIVPAHSWISTSECVGNVGARPVFVDVEQHFYTIDVQKIEQKITERTKAIIPVHLYGHPANMIGIMEIAKKYDLFVLEDCAQAHGADINGKKVGTFGDAASFSFYPGKNLGAYGDAGCMATNNDELASVLRTIANHGQTAKHNHVMEGRNSRLDGIQAAILSAKLPHLNEWTERRRHNASLYDKFLSGKEVGLPRQKAGYKHVYHLYVIQVEDRDSVQQKLRERGVETAIHYPTALPFLPCYKHHQNKVENFPISHHDQSRILSIPMFAELTEEQIKYVADKLA